MLASFHLFWISVSRLFSVNSESLAKSSEGRTSGNDTWWQNKEQEIAHAKVLKKHVII